MFNPDLVHQWRQQVALNPELRSNFLGFKLETREITFDRDAQAPAGAPLGRFYPPAMIFGSAADPSCLRGVSYDFEEAPKAPGPLVRSFREARLVGSGALLSSDGQLYTPHFLLGRNPSEFVGYNAFGHQGFIAEEIDGRALIRFAVRPELRRIDKHAVFFANAEHNNYGSFLCRQLPQMLFASEQGVDCDCYVVSERTPWLQEAMSLIGLPTKPIHLLAEVCGDIFESVTLLDLFDGDGFLRPETRASITELGRWVGRRAACRNPQRLYVSRDLTARRWPKNHPLLNEPEIEEYASSKGFRIVHPETLSFRQQIETFFSASHIVGPSGSGMLNSLFASPPARIVDMEGFSFCVRQHANLYASAGHDYSFAFGNLTDDDTIPAAVRPWRVPVQVIGEAIEWCLS